MQRAGPPSEEIPIVSFLADKKTWLYRKRCMIVVQLKLDTDMKLGRVTLPESANINIWSASERENAMTPFLANIILDYIIIGAW